VAPGAGFALIVGGVVLSLLVLLVGWPRLPAPLAYAFLAVAGGAIGTGALLVQAEAPPSSWVITLGLLGALSPLHGRLVFGRPGPSG